MLLGDRIEQALTTVGINHERVERWIGGLCQCKERKEKLNRLHAWVNRVIDGNIDKAADYLNDILR